MTERELIRALLAKNGIQHKWFAEKMGMSKANFSEKLCRKGNRLQLGVLEKLLDGLGYKLIVVPKEGIFGGECYEISGEVEKGGEEKVKKLAKELGIK